MGAFLLSLFVNHKLRILAIFLVGAHKEKVHACNNSIASCFSLQLITKILYLLDSLFLQNVHHHKVYEQAIDNINLADRRCPNV